MHFLSEYGLLFWNTHLHDTEREVSMKDQLLPYLTPPERGAAFLQVCDRTLDELTAANGIGTLAEKSIHAVLKRFYAGDPAYEEIRCCGFVADIRTPAGIIEIQTRSFYTMKRKLHAFLPECPVTIVYPVVYRKWLSWIDPENGAVSKPRRTSRTNYGFSVFPELYGIKDFLRHPNLSFRLALLDVEEYKMLDGYGPNRKIRASRNDGLPQALIAEVPLKSPESFSYFLPKQLPERFTAGDLAACAKVNRELASIALNILLHMDTVRRIGKTGKAYQYEKAEL